MGAMYKVDSILEINKKEAEQKQAEDNKLIASEQLRADVDYIAMVTGVEL